MAIASNSIRLDDASVGHLERDLEYREARIIEKKYPDYNFAEGRIVPIENLEQPWAMTHSYKMVTAVGQFELIRDYTVNVPMVDILTEEFVHKVHKWGGGYTFNEEEAYAALHMGVPLEEQKISAVRKVERQTLNKLIAFGDKQTNTPGFTNHPDVLRSVAPYKLDATTSTSDQLMTTLVNAVSSMVTLTNGVETPDTLLLPINQYEFLMNRRLDGAVDAMTVMNAFMKNNTHIKNIQPLVELSKAGPNKEDIMIVYRRDPDAIKARVMDSFKFRELLRQAFGFQRPAAFKYGGLVLYYPYSCHIVIGV